MNDMSNESRHFLLWNRIADTGEDKETAFRVLWGEEAKFPLNLCFACDEALDRYFIAHPKEFRVKTPNGKCHYCPINWGAPDCEAYNSPYIHYNRAIRGRGKVSIKDTAILILDLDWNPSPEDIEDDD